MLKKILCLLIITTCISPCFSNEWTLDQMLEVKLIGKSQLSPNGSLICYQVLEENKPALYLSSPAKKIADAALDPQWAPNGESIAYINPSNHQIEIYHLKENKTLPLTDFNQEISKFEWSPSGKILAFLMRTKSNPNAIRSVDEEERANQKLCLISADGKNFRQLTETSFNVGSNTLSDQFTFSPDGKQILLPKTSNAQSSKWDDLEIAKIDLHTGQISSFLPSIAVEPIYSPNGKWVAYIKLQTSKTSAQDVWIVAAEGGTPRALSQTTNRHILSVGALLGWSEDSEFVYVMDYNKTKAEILALPLAGGEPKKFEIKIPSIKNISLSPDHENFTFVGQNSMHPPELYQYSISDKNLTQLTHLNSALPLQLIPQTELIEFKAPDEAMIEGLLTYPLNHQPSKRFPLLVLIHGGPASFSGETFTGSPGVYPIATLASQGYGVLRVNYRGSNAYGLTFREANFADFGGNDYRDIMAGIDSLNEKKLIDMEKLGVMGWSYGGYMTAWIITQTDRFKAASVGAGVVNLISAYGTTDTSSFISSYFGGELWEKFDLFLERSAITRIANIKTPTLIQHGKDDTIVPSSQSLELYQALKRRGVPTKLMLFPHSEHAIHDAKLIEQAAKANLDWFNQYIHGMGVEQ
ncbi:MAG: Dipeptidyl-peptidase 5 [Chlamydiales bacterium]|nr:Dipeptidyl-peptidase 5 [Chlamydiales bacterium]